MRVRHGSPQSRGKDLEKVEKKEPEFYFGWFWISELIEERNRIDGEIKIKYMRLLIKYQLCQIV